MTGLRHIRCGYRRVRVNSTAFNSQDAVVHLAVFPTTSGSWEQVHRRNIVWMHKMLEATSDAVVDRFVLASSIRDVGMYEEDNKPAFYDLDTDLAFDKSRR